MSATVAYKPENILWYNKNQQALHNKGNTSKSSKN